MRIDFYGHACVGVQGSKKILIDPYLSGNPAASLTPEQAEADYLLITHGHGDHLGDAVEIAKRTGAQVVAMVELANWLGHILAGQPCEKRCIRSGHHNRRKNDSPNQNGAYYNSDYPFSFFSHFAEEIFYPRPNLL